MYIEDNRLASEWCSHCKGIWGEEGPEEARALRVAAVAYKIRLAMVEAVLEAQGLEGEALREAFTNNPNLVRLDFLVKVFSIVQGHIQAGMFKEVLTVLAREIDSPVGQDLAENDPEAFQRVENLQAWIKREFSEDKIPQRFLEAAEPGADGPS